jgi:uncharacterized membrane protein HdeD (DUF308 family)
MRHVAELTTIERAPDGVEEVGAMLSRLFSAIFGILLIVFPGPGAISLIWLIGSYALIFGILMLALAFRLRGMRETPARQAARPV